MVNIIVVDDEERIRLGLVKLISQIGEEYQVKGIYASGIELLADIDNVEADLLITDIKMPKLNGLELVEKVKSMRPEMKFAILSGFDDFSYARQALRYGAMEYLLKPVDKTDLERLLVKVKTDLEQIGNENKFNAEDHLKLLLLNDSEDLPMHMTEAASRYLKAIPALQSHFAVFVLRGNPVVTRQNWQFAVAGTQREWFFVERDEQTTAAIVCIGDRDHADTTKELAQTLLYRLPASFCGQLGCSDVFNGSNWLRQSYLQAERAVQHGWYSDAKKGYSVYSDLPKKQESVANPYIIIDRTFREALALADYERARESLHLWVEEMIERRPLWNDLFDACVALHALLPRGSEDHGQPPQQTQSMIIERPESFANARAFTSYFLGLIMELLSEKELARQENRVIETVKAYIRNHYTEEMELNRLAEKVFLTPSYLSKLFKTETGETLTEYFISVRIERAKELLRDQRALKTYEVGEKVGYFDPAYFNKIFKKTVGCTPKEYRDRVR
ncbi:response regulator [Cohnella cholangitidis]|uniref:Response regulator n=1 Tax=Cohnella cholangitidis TaxID=2598458 RepID=A0A7G5C408_9BACL|nr:response regulator [Cohnella cholangitidis]QMV43942.1 response regulator [Cohnella cholangitidis]